MIFNSGSFFEKHSFFKKNFKTIEPKAILIKLFFVSCLFFGLGLYIVPDAETDSLLVFKVLVNTLDISAWLLLGYAGFQELGYKKEIKILEDNLDNQKNIAGLESYNVHDEISKDEYVRLDYEVLKLEKEINKRKAMIEKDRVVAVCFVFAGIVLFVLTAISKLFLLAY